MAGAVRIVDLSKVAIGAVGFFMYRFIIIRVSRPLHESMNTEKDPEKRERYLDRACESTNKLSFHVFALVWGYRVIKRCGWLPTTLGGSVPMETLFTDIFLKEFPFGSPPPEVVSYGLYCSGYHVMDLIRHLVSTRKSDFVEMLFHHVVSVILLMGYMLPNGHVLGSFLAVIHDVSDCFINLGRIFQPTKHFKTTALGLVGCTVTWLYTRIILLPYSIWLVESPSNLAGLSKLEHGDTIVWYVHSMCFFLTCLFLLHFYWFILIIQMIWHMITKKQIVDM